MIPDPGEITAGFDAISLAGLNDRAALMTREDNKYFLTWEAFEDFAGSLLNTYAILEIEDRRIFDYNTVYFDTDSLDSYRAYVQGRRKQFKCRTRFYVDSGLCFFEVKLKGGRGETIKKRMDYDHADFGSISSAARDFLQGCLRGVYGEEFEKPLYPAMSMPYRRMTLVAKDSRERITCDFDLSFIKGDGAVRSMPDKYVMVETKSGRGRGVADHVLWRMGERPVRGSKYCLGVSLFHPDARNNVLRRTLKSYFVGQDGSTGSPRMAGRRIMEAT